MDLSVLDRSKPQCGNNPSRAASRQIKALLLLITVLQVLASSLLYRKFCCLGTVNIGVALYCEGLCSV